MTNPSGFVLSALDVSIILGSLALVVAVGLWAARSQGDTARSYFLASDKLPWWIIGSAFVATSVSSEQIVGTIGAAYQYGMGIANWEIWCLPTYALLLLFFIPVYLKNRITTVPEFLGRRYGPLCGDLYSWVMLVAYALVFQVTVLYSGSLAFHRLTGWNFYAILWVMVVLVGLYTVKGGLASVMWTDAVQCVMLLGGGILLYFLALRNIPGGFSAMVRADPARFHLYHPPDDPMTPFLGLIAATFGVFLFYQATNQVMIQRVLAARSTWDGLMGIVFAGFINLLRPLVTCFLGFIVYHWIHHMHRAEPLADKDHTFPFALSTFASDYGLRGVILAGFLAAVMSTVSALANSTATIFALDVYKKLIRKDASDQKVVRVGQAASLVSLALAAIVCPIVEEQGGIFEFFQTWITYLATPFVSVFILGMLWKRANNAGAMFGVIGGLVIQFTFAIGGAKEGSRFLGLPLNWLYRLVGRELHFYYLAFFAQVVIMIGVVAVSLSTAPPPAERWKPFVWTPAHLSRYDEGFIRPWYQSIKLWFGLYAAVWIFLYWSYW